MEMSQQVREIDEVNWVMDHKDCVPVCERPDNGMSDSNLMNNLHSIMTLSLIFFERLVRPLHGAE